MNAKNKVDKPTNTVKNYKNIKNEKYDLIENDKVNSDDYCFINGAKIEGNACSTIRNNLGKDV